MDKKVDDKYTLSDKLWIYCKIKQQSIKQQEMALDMELLTRMEYQEL